MRAPKAILFAMSTLAEIEAAVDRLSRSQQEELYASLGARLEASPRKRLSPEEFEAWLKTARGVGLSGMTTDEIMTLTRGEE